MEILTVFGLILNLLGSILLALSLNRVLKMINSSILALEHFKNTYLSSPNVVSFEGLDKHRKGAFNTSRLKMLVGILLLIFGFILQLIPVLTQLLLNWPIN